MMVSLCFARSCTDRIMEANGVTFVIQKMLNVKFNAQVASTSKWTWTTSLLLVIPQNKQRQHHSWCFAMSVLRCLLWISQPHQYQLRPPSKSQSPRLSLDVSDFHVFFMVSKKYMEKNGPCILYSPSKKPTKKPWCEGLELWSFCPGTVLVLQRVLLLAIPQPDGIADFDLTHHLWKLLLTRHFRGPFSYRFFGGQKFVGICFLVGK